MHPQWIEQIPPFKSPSLSFSAPLFCLSFRQKKNLFPLARHPATIFPPPPLSSSLSPPPPPSPLLSSFLRFFPFFPPYFILPSSPWSFVLALQRFRSPIVWSAFEICKEAVRETDRQTRERQKALVREGEKPYSFQPLDILKNLNTST